MHSDNIHRWKHDHIFGQNRVSKGERSTLIVIALTIIMMVIEIIAGIIYGSMALLADGLHMGSHAVALGITAFAYTYARRHAHNENYSFGTGKMNALGGYSGAILLAVFALIMAGESVLRIFNPVDIIFNQAIFVAVIGLVVNGFCAFILDEDDHDHHDHNDVDERDQSHPHHDDHNLKSAYLHVLTDALTSILAIIALLVAKYFGMTWIDPVMGIVGAVLVSSWSIGLLRNTSYILLDQQGPKHILQAIRRSIEDDGDSRVTDLHLWSIGPNVYAAVIMVVAHAPVSPDEYRARIPTDLGLAHISIEIHETAASNHENNLVRD